MKKSLGRGVFWGFLALLILGVHPVPAQTVPARASLLEDGAYGHQLITRIGQAKRRIICAFYLFKVGDRRGNLPAAVARELVKARQRGVEVTVILEGDQPVGDDNRAAASQLARGGVRVLFARGSQATHVKAIAIDDRYVLLGSHNLTHSALSRNDELSVLLDSPQLAGQVRRYLEGIR